MPWIIPFGSANGGWLFTMDQMLCSGFKGRCKSDTLLIPCDTLLPSYKPPNPEPYNSQYVSASLGALYIFAQATLCRNSDLLCFIKSMMSLAIRSVFYVQLRKKNASDKIMAQFLSLTSIIRSICKKCWFLKCGMRGKFSSKNRLRIVVGLVWGPRHRCVLSET